jgi:hypothetical protein
VEAQSSSTYYLKPAAEGSTMPMVAALVKAQPAWSPRSITRSKLRVVVLGAIRRLPNLRRSGATDPTVGAPCWIAFQ